MPFIFKTLHASYNNGPASIPLYTVSSPATSAIVSNIRLYNRGTASATTNIVFKSSSADASPKTVVQVPTSASSSSIVVVELTLGMGNIIEANTIGTGSLLDFVVFGVERV